MKGGPGYHRMIKRLGEKGYETLRQETLRMQQEIRAQISGDYKSYKEDRTLPNSDSYPLPRCGRGR